MRCSECRHYKINYQRPNGTCHKSAPKAVAVQVYATPDERELDNLAFVAAWPEVAHDESCGDFASAERHTTPEEPEEGARTAPPEEPRQSSLPPELRLLVERPEPKTDPRPLPLKEAIVCVFVIGPDGIIEMT